MSVKKPHARRQEKKKKKNNFLSPDLSSIVCTSLAISCASLQQRSTSYFLLTWTDGRTDGSGFKGVSRSKITTKKGTHNAACVYATAATPCAHFFFFFFYCGRDNIIISECSFRETAFSRPLINATQNRPDPKPLSCAPTSVPPPASSFFLLPLFRLDFGIGVLCSGAAGQQQRRETVKRLDSSSSCCLVLCTVGPNLHKNN